MPLTYASVRRMLPWVYLALLLALAALLFVLVVASRVVGVEINTETLDRREFVVWRIPLFGFPFSPVYRDPPTPSSLGRFLREKKWWSTGENQPDSQQAWRVAGETSVQGYAASEVDLLRILLQDDRTWVEWSRRHPKRAEKLWPAVARQVGKGKYRALPDLFGLAVEKGEDAVAWEQQFRAWQVEAELP